ncbi:hypothetical protein G3I59_05580 [Amycolatopsis rubida]|uniref:Secreted protein n=1 Tax=Amycolatopsis rubida TaxID=112413 RepID=A0A1I5J8I4_9PSEU|nr:MULTISPECIES: hypothetical protein [Amycolatopsis]MYW90103.1 hypothetical protein [Amycolatopsis rubida]NEC55080.1 hypothetical protein [Amycolatopsis rubida]OAP28639.1 hypothetical protein A4R44_00430 [Amycolatopsis sp. M39]SFO68903.1 hypothetical protein SAMN05421854_102989 [Amycolatopsis rubida]
MARAQHGTTARVKSRTGLLPLAAGILSAVALTGAAFATVEAAGCEGPAQYIRHDNHIELVGGCVNGTELPATTGTRHATALPEDSKP